jgi:hypothetical protein
VPLALAWPLLGSTRRRRRHAAYTLGVRWTALIAVVAFGLAPGAAAARSPCERATPPPSLAVAARSHVHSVQITVPAQFDFTLAALTLNVSAGGARVTATGPTGFQYVAAAAPCDAPKRIFIVVVNRLPRGSSAPTPVSITLRVKTHNAEVAPAIVQHVNVLADGAPGQDCSSIPRISAEPPFTNYSGPRPLLGSELSPLLGETGKVADALNQACGVVWDTSFERWVRQEPPNVLVHP